MRRLAGWVAAVLVTVVAGGLLVPGMSTLRVTPLAKADGWRDGLGPPLPPFAYVEIAYDLGTAERAWRDNVPDGLPGRTGRPVLPGLYGDIADVDFATHAVIVWSSGESSACPGWLASIGVDASGTVHIVMRDTGSGFFGGDCTSDYHPYRMVVAVPRTRLPEPDLLPTADVEGVPGTGRGGGAVVRAYPDEP